MRVEDLTKRDLKKNPLMVVDKTLDRFKNVPIPQDKIDSANSAIGASNFYEVFPHLKKELITKP
ncbi:MAG: hypothetical protein IPK35_04530 [Saprospiraceae bacterium]|jgi:hypothetical protein|nr:hypothetical protein [Saprospiraceae bacterium]